MVRALRGLKELLRALTSFDGLVGDVRKGLKACWKLKH